MQPIISLIKRRLRWITGAAAALVLMGALSVVVADDLSNDVLNYYVDRARHVFESRNPAGSGAQYSYRAHFYYKVIEAGNKIGRIDSAVIDYYYSWGKLDSQLAVSGEYDRFRNTDLSYPDVFAEDYVFNLFPNDTGGSELAIGFDTRTASDTLPTGLVIINREAYYPMWLYLSYPNKVGYKRYTRSFRFTEVQGKTFADSVWEVGAKAGVFFSEYYRVEVGISDIVINQ